MILMFLFFVLSALFFIFVLPASGQNIAQFKVISPAHIRYYRSSHNSQK